MVNGGVPKVIGDSPLTIHDSPFTKLSSAMLTNQEQEFIRYWEANRQSKKRFLRQFSMGFPLGVGIVLVVLVNLLSGWYKKADMVLQTHSSVIIVVLIAGVGIATFVTVFSSKHKWDQNEQRYLELKAREQGFTGERTGAEETPEKEEW
jgi:hypothetical protein